jgi:hypothetical protein
MSRQTVIVDSQVLTVAFDDPAPVAEHLWAIAEARTEDEITEAPLTARLLVQVSEPRIGVNYGDDGAFCLVARPWLRFPPLFSPSYDVHLSVVAGGYAPFDLTVNVPSNQRNIAAPALAGATVLTLNSTAALAAGQRLLVGPANTPAEHRKIQNLGPGVQQVTLDSAIVKGRAAGDPVVADAWTPVDLGVIGLRREAVTIRGRAVQRSALTNTDVPLAGASITVTDYWWTLAALRAQQPGLMTQPNPALRAFALSVAPGLYAARPAPAGQLAALTLQAPAGDDHLLLDAAVAGGTSIRVSNRQLLASGTFLRVDPDRGDAAETQRIVSISGYGPPDQPGVAVLQFPLRNSHRAGARVLRLTNPFPPSPPKSFRRAAVPGDRCVFLDDIGMLLTDDTVQITGGAAATEYQRITPLTVVSDANGYFRFPAIQRIAALQLHATSGALMPLDFPFQPDYAARENWLDVVFA